MDKIEEIARVLEPQAWAALGTGDTLAYKHRRTSSLRKARAAYEVMTRSDGEVIDRVRAAVATWFEGGQPDQRGLWDDETDRLMKAIAPTLTQSSVQPDERN